jgi:hypothetical protein
MSPYDLFRMTVKLRWQTRLVMQKYRVERITETENRLLHGDR